MATLVLIPDAVAEQSRAYGYVTQLGLLEYTISLEYRERQDRWYLDLIDANGVPLVSEIKLVVGFSLLFRHRKAGMPLGALMVTDRDDTGEECGFEDLGRRCGLIWIDDDDLDDPPNEGLIVQVLT